MHVTTVGLDLAKHVFQVHGIIRTDRFSFAVSSAEASSSLLPPVAALPDWHGGVLHRPFLGA